MVGKKLKKNNPKIDLNILYTKEKTFPAYISNHNSTRQKIILLMVPNREKEV